MIWFRRANRLVNRRVREVKQELHQLEREIQRIQTSSPDNTEVTESNSHPPSATSHPQSATYSPPSTNPSPIQPGVQPRHTLSPREMDFFSPAEKEFIRLKPETPQFESAPAHPADPPPLAARITPYQPRERLAFYLRSGTVQTLKPLRYERRVARNRTIAWIMIAAVMIFLCVHFLIKSCHH